MIIRTLIYRKYGLNDHFVEDILFKDSMDALKQQYNEKIKFREVICAGNPINPEDQICAANKDGA